VTSVDPRPATLADPFVASRPATVVRSYIALTKPRIIELLLVTTVPTMILAQEGLPSAWLVVATLIGGTLAAGSANTLNCYLDRDIDAVMTRTAHRPLVTGAVSPRGALGFGLVLGCSSTIWLAVFVNPLSAALAVAAILFYVFVYTMGLKRRTPQNIVWGGAAGCMPVLIGWAAVTNSLAWAPWVLFAVIFFWTPPHYWPLSMRFREDYSNASIPMLPVVADNVTVAKKIVLYSWLMVAASIALWPVAHTGVFYGVVAIVLGAAFLAEAYRLLVGAKRGVSERELKPMRLFHGSITYLTLLFVAVALTPFIRF
jgi:heme o synthase